MQRRSFTRLALGAITCGLSACAAPAIPPPKVESPAAAAVKLEPTPTAQSAAPKPPATTVPPTQEPAPAVVLPGEPLAPEISSDTWINASQPVVWSALRGKVVMVEFWTFGCINCQHVIPDLKGIYSDYKGKGFTILGMHSPEFDYEKDLGNVRQAVLKAGIEYPVGIDNDFSNWQRYRNRYWPARYLVDKRGVIRFTHIGEGGDAETRQWIDTLLAE